MHFVRIIYCFSALAIMLVLSGFPFGKTNKVNNAFKYLISHAYKIMYYKNISQKWHYGLLFGIFGVIRWYISHIFFSKMYLFTSTAYLFLPFPDKNLWFSSQRRREGVVGDANGSISK